MGTVNSANDKTSRPPVSMPMDIGLPFPNAHSPEAVTEPVWYTTALSLTTTRDISPTFWTRLPLPISESETMLL
jgi:hypothetical protein